MTPKDIMKYSEFRLKESRLYEQGLMKPIFGGALDERMGINYQSHGGSEVCLTCKLDWYECPGHFSYIKLKLPVFHIGFFQKTVQTLQVICKNCSRVLLSPYERERFMNHYKRVTFQSQKKAKVFKNKGLSALRELCKKFKGNENEKARICDYCNYSNGIIRKQLKEATQVEYILNATLAEGEVIQIPSQYQEEQSMDLEAKLRKERVEVITPLRALQLFQKIPLEDMQLLFMNPQCEHYPKDFIITHFPVPPIVIRPSVDQGNFEVSNDPLTKFITEIVKYNKKIEEYLADGREEKMVNYEWYKLQGQVTQYFNSEAPNIPRELKKGDKEYRCMSKRLKSKHGRFRQNLLGKRVDYAGRSVISPDPNVAIRQVVIPEEIARKITVQEMVTDYNMLFLKKLVKNGQRYPGAAQVQKKGSKDVLYVKSRRLDLSAGLEVGDRVHRHLLLNDVVLFNRQPSLHRPSIMAFQVKVMKDKTLKFNECCCKPFNADFDGDEMNVHAPQTLLARAEAKHLMLSQMNLLVPKNGSPIITLMQDFLTCSYLITSKDTFYTKSQFCQICTFFTNERERIDLPRPVIFRPCRLYTGKQLIGVILNQSRGEVKDRIIVNISLPEKNYQNHPTLKKYACPSDKWVIFRDSQLICGSLGKKALGSGNKTGLFYALIKDNSFEAAAMVMLKFSRLSSRLISSLGMSFGLSDVTPSQEISDLSRKSIQQTIRECKEKIIKSQESEQDGEELELEIRSALNELKKTVGEKCIGKLLKTNCALIMAVCGAKGDNNNLNQMMAFLGQQNFQGQRIPNGFHERTLPHFKRKSVDPYSKGFVKHSFYQGLEATEYFFHAICGREGLVDTAIKTADTGYLQRRIMKLMEDISIQYDMSARTFDGSIVQFAFGGDMLDPSRIETEDCPINLMRLLEYSKTNVPFSHDQTPLTPSEIISESKRFLELPNPIVRQSYISKQFRAQVLEFFDQQSQELSHLWKSFGITQRKNRKQIKLRKIINQIFVLTQPQMVFFFEKIWWRYAKIMIQPGEMIGVVTATSIGEPATQMTLKTFHQAGLGSQITAGVPRMKEIIDANRNIKTPIITAQILDNTNVENVKRIFIQIEKTTLNDIAKCIRECYSPSGCYIEVEIDFDLMLALRIQDVDMHHIVSVLKNAKIHNKVNQHLITCDERVVRIAPATRNKNELLFELQEIKKKILKVIIYGVKTANRVIIKKKKDRSKGKDKTKAVALEIVIEGIGLQEVLITPGIDFVKTASTHIREVYQVLGVEAARQQTVREIQSLFESYSINVDRRHVSLLVDRMTQFGTILGCTRNDIPKLKDNTLFLAGYERSIDILYDAAYFGLSDDIKGVSESIMLGQQIKSGTGLFDIISAK